MKCRDSLSRVAAVLAVGAALALSSNAAAAAGAAHTGIISGVVKYSGKPPARPRIEITKDKEVCGRKLHLDESLIVSPERDIKNVVVVVKGAPGAAKPVSVRFDQKDCDYIPHVLAFPAGSTVAIINSDGILHSVHAMRGERTLFDMKQPGFKKKITATVKQPGVIRIMCDEHGWMQGWWYVTDTPYFAVTGARGRFIIKGVPPGKYTLEAWQEKLGRRAQKIEVKSGATTTANITYPPE